MREGVPPGPRLLLQGALGMPEGGESSVRLVTVVPHTASWELRAGLLHASLAVGGSAAGEAAGAAGSLRSLFAAAVAVASDTHMPWM